MRGQHICLLNDWKKKFACVHVFTFEDVIVSQCVCVCALVPCRPPSQHIPLIPAWDLRGPIKAGLPATPASPGPLC